MKAAVSSKILVPLNKTVQRHISEEINFRSRHRESFKPCVSNCLLYIGWHLNLRHITRTNIPKTQNIGNVGERFVLLKDQHKFS
jgi:hypothetical protein